jgi:AsmA-like C-terminal region/AsmA family
VKKLRRIALFALGAVIALGAIVLLGVNLYVQSQGTQAKIQQELSQRLGVPLKIRQMSVTPWGGLELSGITIAQNPGAGRGHFLEARTFRLRVRFLSLFSHRLVIKEVSLVNPKVVWPQDANGKWRLPGARQEEARASEPEIDVARSPISTGPTAGAPITPGTEGALPNAGASAQERQENRLAGGTPQLREAIGPEVQRVDIKNGNFSFLDRQLRLLGKFSGVDFRTNIRSGSTFRGDAKVAKISFLDRFFLKQLESPLRYEPDVLELSKMSARAAGGNVTGYFAMQPEAEDSPFTARVKFGDVLADQIVTDAGGPKGIVQGKLEGNFEASGKTAYPDALLGRGEIFLREGRVQQYSLLVLVGQILQIEELRELDLEQAAAKYHVSSGLITIDELILRTPNIRLSASGAITFDGDLKLDSQLAINDKIRSQLFKAIRQNFQPSNEPGYYALDFKVGGTIDRPSTNLMDRLVGRDVGNIMNSLFGSGKTDRQKKKRKRTEAVLPAAPSSSGAAQIPAAETTPTPEETKPPPSATPVLSP